MTLFPLVLCPPNSKTSLISLFPSALRRPPPSTSTRRYRSQEDVNHQQSPLTSRKDSAAINRAVSSLCLSQIDPTEIVLDRPDQSVMDPSRSETTEMDGFLSGLAVSDWNRSGIEPSRSVSMTSRPSRK